MRLKGLLPQMRPVVGRTGGENFSAIDDANSAGTIDVNIWDAELERNRFSRRKVFAVPGSLERAGINRHRPPLSRHKFSFPIGCNNCPAGTPSFSAGAYSGAVGEKLDFVW